MNLLCIARWFFQRFEHARHEAYDPTTVSHDQQIVLKRVEACSLRHQDCNMLVTASNLPKFAQWKLLGAVQMS